MSGAGAKACCQLIVARRFGPGGLKEAALRCAQRRRDYLNAAAENTLVKGSANRVLLRTAVSPNTKTRRGADTHPSSLFPPFTFKRERLMRPGGLSASPRGGFGGFHPRDFQVCVLVKRFRAAEALVVLRGPETRGAVNQRQEGRDSRGPGAGPLSRTLASDAFVSAKGPRSRCRSLPDGPSSRGEVRPGPGEGERSAS